MGLYFFLLVAINDSPIHSLGWDKQDLAINSLPRETWLRDCVQIKAIGSQKRPLIPLIKLRYPYLCWPKSRCFLWMEQTGFRYQIPYRVEEHDRDVEFKSEAIEAFFIFIMSKMSLIPLPDPDDDEVAVKSSGGGLCNKQKKKKTKSKIKNCTIYPKRKFILLPQEQRQRTPV